MGIVSSENSMESRHFFDDDRQITITLEAKMWGEIQIIANKIAESEGWLGGRGSDWDHLNIWVVRRLNQRPNGVDKNQWVLKAIE